MASKFIAKMMSILKTCQCSGQSDLAIDEFGYVNTKIIDNDGVKEVVDLFAPMIEGNNGNISY